MKKLLLLLAFALPVSLSAQWSIVPSVGAGMSKFKGISPQIYKFKNALSFDAGVNARYCFPYVYITTGLGYMNLSSKGELMLILDGGSDPGMSYKAQDNKFKSFYIPIGVGFYIPNIKVSPIVELGGLLSYSIEHGDYIDSQDYETKSPLFSFYASAGVRWTMKNSNALEFKLRYLNTGDVYTKIADINWVNYSVSIAYVVNL